MIELNKVGFVYTVEHIGVDGKIKSVEKIKNIIPLVGTTYILDTALMGGLQSTNWYVGLYKASRTPLVTDDMASFIADCDESADYGGTSRLIANFSEVVNGETTTIASPTIFTFATAATITGGLITSGVTINNTSGLLLSAVQFSSPKDLEVGEILNVPVGIALTSV